MRTEQQIRAELDEAESKRRRLRKELRKHKGLSGKGKDRTWTRERNGHKYEYLVGWFDHVKRRIEIYQRAGGEVLWYDKSDPSTIADIRPAMCQGCVETHPVGWKEGDWFHNSKTLGGRRCDCPECSLYTCKPFHVRYHNRMIKSGKVDA